MGSRTAKPAPRKLAPSLLTSGFVALDTLIDDDVLGYSAGGTAGNVAAALSFFGWSASAAALIGKDPAAQRLKRDLTVAGVSTADLYVSDRGQTAQVIHVVGKRGHRFLFSCSDCGRPFAKSQPPPVEIAEQVFERRGGADVFFFDRASRFSVALAEQFANSGALVVFEPATRGRQALVERARKAAHVVKLSAESPGHSGKRIVPAHSRQLVIVTDGENGARMRIGREPWRQIGALPTPSLVDAAGAGDWTTAGLLHQLVEGGLDPCMITEERAYEALRFGQALGSLSCGWRGARGIAKRRDVRGVIKDALALIRGEQVDTGVRRERFSFRASPGLCRICLSDGVHSVRRAIA